MWTTLITTGDNQEIIRGMSRIKLAIVKSYPKLSSTIHTNI
jgi:hypothetical protein